MTIDKLYEILKLMVDVDDELNLQTSLILIRDNLSNLTNSPATAQYQTALASALSAFSDGADRLPAKIKPSQWTTIEELGGSEYFDPSIAEKVRTSVERNAMTPSVARDFVQDLATRREDFLQTVSTCLKGLTSLLSAGKPTEPLPPAEAFFTIPRNLFGNQLGSFGKEIKFINQLVEHLSEAVTGEMQPVELQALSSSNPTIGIVTVLDALKLLGSIINSFLEAWKKVQKMRNLREQVTEVGLSKTATDEMTEKISTTVEEVVEESTKLSLAGYKHDGSRRNELENALRQDIRRLVGQIERGLTVEIHTREDLDTNQSEKKELQAIADIAQKMQFPNVSNDPMLLTSGQILEGEIVKTRITTKRTTTEKVSTKRTSHSADKDSE
jgi:hypothetical protein